MACSARQTRYHELQTRRALGAYFHSTYKGGMRPTYYIMGQNKSMAGTVAEEMPSPLERLAVQYAPVRRPVPSGPSALPTTSFGRRLSTGAAKFHRVERRRESAGARSRHPGHDRSRVTAVPIRNRNGPARLLKLHGTAWRGESCPLYRAIPRGSAPPPAIRNETPRNGNTGEW